jgi:hypothetical protein
VRPRARSRDAAIVYAQLVEINAMPDRRMEHDRIVSDRLIPALKEERGLAGVFHLVDGETGNALLIVLWESADHAQRPLNDRGPSLLEAYTSLTAVSTSARSRQSVWEVVTRV